jgi:AcrR family transcriptional regulator
MKTFVRKKKVPTRKRDPEQKCAQILKAARELFAVQGYDDTPTAQIAEQAKVSEGALFHQFPTKRDLFSRLAEDYGRQCAAATMSAEPGEITSESILQAAFSFAENDRDLYRFFARTSMQLFEHGDTPFDNALLAVIRQQIEWDMGQGKTPAGDPYILAEFQLAIVQRAYTAWLKSGKQSDMKNYIREAARCMDAIAS